MRHYTFIDHLLTGFDAAIRAIVVPENREKKRETPGHDLVDSAISFRDKKHIAGLMRVNHAGEVCAKALYHGQALTAKLEGVRQKMQIAADEEIDHLAWCEERIMELGSKVSILNIFWYAGSFLLGAAAGLAGDGLSLGFVAETEKQVVKHLHKHLQQIPKDDFKTRAILSQMEEDEASHAQMAVDAGGINLPSSIKEIMRITSKCLTISSYYI